MSMILVDRGEIGQVLSDVAAGLAESAQSRLIAIMRDSPEAGAKLCPECFESVLPKERSDANCDQHGQ